MLNEFLEGQERIRFFRYQENIYEIHRFWRKISSTPLRETINFNRPQHAAKVVDCEGLMWQRKKSFSRAMIVGYFRSELSLRGKQDAARHAEPRGRADRPPACRHAANSDSIRPPIPI